jgi:hypothetical protein
LNSLQASKIGPGDTLGARLVSRYCRPILLRTQGKYGPDLKRHGWFYVPCFSLLEESPGKFSTLVDRFVTPKCPRLFVIQ